MSELLLQQQGLCIDTASSGEQAMDMLAKRDYDLLLIDVHLPGLSGCARHHAQRRTRAHHRSAPLRTAARRRRTAARRRRTAARRRRTAARRRRTAAVVLGSERAITTPHAATGVCAHQPRMPPALIPHCVA
jgi:CheY-like chemotaxis protein